MTTRDTLDCGHLADEGMPAQIRRDDGTLETIQGWTRHTDDAGRTSCAACHDKAGGLLECGHMPTWPRSPFTTGYGTDSDGRRACFQCCADKERASMIETGRAVLYLTHKKSPEQLPGASMARGLVVRWEVTDWPGLLRFPAYGVTESRHGGGFGAQRTDAYFRGPDGATWHAVNRGDNDIARCHRVAERKRAAWRTWRGVRYVARGKAAPAGFRDPCTCGTCGRTWDDAHGSTWTPTPSGRCPFEYWHTTKEQRA